MKKVCLFILVICQFVFFVGCENEDSFDENSIICTGDKELTGDYDLAFLDAKDSLVYFVEMDDLNDQVSRIDMFAGPDLISYTFDDEGRPETYTAYDKSCVVHFGNYSDNTVDVTISDGENIYLLDKIEAPVSARTRSGNHSGASSDNKPFETKKDALKWVWDVVESSLELIVDAARLKYKDAAFDIAMTHFRVFEPIVNSKGYSRVLDATDFAASFGAYLAVAGTFTGGSFYAWALAMESAWDAGNALGELVAELQISLTNVYDVLKAMLKGGHGKLKATLSWNFYADIDLHAIEPNGNEIYFFNPVSSTGGFLDVDNVEGGPGAVENIYWENPIDGLYKFYLNYYDGEQSGICRAVITYNGKAMTFDVGMTEGSTKNFHNMIINKSTRSALRVNTNGGGIEITIDTKKLNYGVPIVKLKRVSN